MTVGNIREKNSGASCNLVGKAGAVGPFLFLLLFGCFFAFVPGVQAKTAPEKCQDCHREQLDPNHRLACTRCHAGDPAAESADEAHRGMIARPASPDNMKKACGPCHRQVHTVRASIHFTLRKEINLVRRALGADKPLAGPEALVHEKADKGLVALGDDMLRRRCLRCHVYYPGDNYPATRHGTGCAACHLRFEDGRMVSHRFVRTPSDEFCLHCHYSNFVGADYYGRFEQDYNADYRTPLDRQGNSHRPYGVEYHQLVPDIHQQAGMACVDCHSGAELMGYPGKARHRETASGKEQSEKRGAPAPKATVACTDCHTLHGKPVSLVTRLTGKKLVAPPMRDKVHDRYVGKVDCAVCHAQWTFDDEGTYLLRQDTMNFKPWADLTVQSSSEVERQLDDALFGARTYDKPFMRDKISGALMLGVWFKGFGQRRWAKVPVCTDKKGKLRVCRPLLDLYLTYVDQNGKVLYDSRPIVRKQMKLLPYEPHTIGKAGLFFRRRFVGLLEKTNRGRSQQ